MNRRSFLTTGIGVAALTMTAGSMTSLFAADKKKIRMALQVYSLREEAEKDLAGTLKKIAAMGYEGVEFAGYYGHSAQDVRKMLDDCGLVAMSTHIGVPSLLGDTFKKTVEFEKTLGNSNLIVSGGIAAAIGTDAGNQMTADLFNELAAKAARREMFVGFHAHGSDFDDVNGTTAWDLFLSRTRPEVVAQMDVGNCLEGHADPYAAMRKFPGRGKLVHLKAYGPHGTVIGDSVDKVDWKQVFDICENIAGTQWYILEQESFKEGVCPFDACAEALNNLKAKM